MYSPPNKKTIESGSRSATNSITFLQGNYMRVCDTAQISLNHVTHEWGMATAQTILEDHGRARSPFELNLHTTLYSQLFDDYADTAVVT
jgi:hypothetical protein